MLRALVGAPVVIILFGLSCAKPCSIETDVVRLLSDRGLVVKPAAQTAQRPTGETASPEPRDQAALLEADRVLVLDLEANERVLWLTHFVRGTPGTWSIGRVVCSRDEKGSLECPELESVLAKGLRARRPEDVDLVSALRFQAKLVGACIKAGDATPIDERIFGRVEMDLEADPSGAVKVRAIAPALVAKAPLGKCLRRAMEEMNVGPFEGEAIRFRIPIDLD